MAGKPRKNSFADLIRSNISLIEELSGNGIDHVSIFKRLIDGTSFVVSFNVYMVTLRRVRAKMRSTVSTGANAPKVVAPENSGGGAVTADGNVGKGIAPARHTPAKSASNFERLMVGFKHNSISS